MKARQISCLFILLLLVSGACSTTSAPPISKDDPPPTAEIDKAVRDHLKGMTVHGVTLHRQTDDYYVVGADADDPRAGNDVWQLIVRRYDDNGRKYWKAEDLSMKVVEALNGQDKTDK